MNKVILLGNVGKDPKMRMADGRPVAEFSLATSERRQSKGEDGRTVDVELTEWHRIVMWGRAAEYAEKYIRKGMRLLVEGKIRTREWQDHNALRHTVTEIYVDSFELLPR
ncbi:MAG: single-stranded DNA-binding protein [Muribaculaceae bacterium]|nr:single-stranded DNA-binding protein [Muribaculaceae bacterium]